MTQQQKRTVFICLGIAVGLSVIRGIVRSVRQIAYYQQVIQQQQQGLRQQQNVIQQLRARPKEECNPEPVKSPQAAQAAPPPATAPPPAPPLPQTASPFARVSGVWAGQVGLLDRGLCWLRLEIKPDITTPGRFTGISAIKCAPYGQLVQRNAKAENLNAINPESAIISGTEKDGVLQFQVDKVTQTDAHGCAPESFVVTPFGLSRFAVEWTEDKCAGGRTILARAIR